MLSGIHNSGIPGNVAGSSHALREEGFQSDGECRGSGQGVGKEVE